MERHLSVLIASIVFGLPAVAMASSTAARQDNRMFGDVLTLTGKTGFSVGVSGYANIGYFYGILDDTSPAGASDASDASNKAQDGILQDAEIHFKASKKIPEYGLTIKYQVQLEAATKGDQIDEHYAEIEHKRFGKLIIGAENEVAHKLAAYGPSFVAGHKFYGNSFDYLEPAHRANDRLIGSDRLDADDTDLFPAVNGEEGKIVAAAGGYDITQYGFVFDGGGDDNERIELGASPKGRLTDSIYETRHSKDAVNDALKISYISPRFQGLQFGLSYIPSDEDDAGEEGKLLRNGANDHAIAWALNYEREFEDIGIEASFGHVIDDGGDGFHELSAGAQLAYGPFAVGGNWIMRQNYLGVEDATANGFHVSTSYKIPNLLPKTKVGLGFTYTTVEADDGHKVQVLGDESGGERPVIATLKAGELAGLDQTYLAIQVGGGTELSEGVSLGYFYEYSSQDFKGKYYKDQAHSFVGLLLALKF